VYPPSGLLQLHKLHYFRMSFMNCGCLLADRNPFCLHGAELPSVDVIKEDLLTDAHESEPEVLLEELYEDSQRPFSLYKDVIREFLIPDSHLQSQRDVCWNEVYADSKQFTTFVRTLPKTTFSLYIPVEIGNIILQYYNDFGRCFDRDDFFRRHQTSFLPEPACDLLLSFFIDNDLLTQYSAVYPVLCAYCSVRKREKHIRYDRQFFKEFCS
jgi:hypothetical protein